MFQEDQEGRKWRVKRRRVSHIPRLMHGAIDSGSLPANCPHFKEREEGRHRREGGREEEYTSMCKGGRWEGYN